MLRGRSAFSGVSNNERGAMVGGRKSYRVSSGETRGNEGKKTKKKGKSCAGSRKILIET